MSANPDLVKLCAQKHILAAVYKDEFDKLSPRLRAQALNAPIELVRELRFTIERNNNNTAYAFSGERAFTAAHENLREILRAKNRPLVTVGINPVLYFKQIDDTKISKIIVDLGTKTELIVEAEDLAECSHLAVIAKLARLEKIYIIQAHTKDALMMELEGNQYALGFISSEDAKAHLKGLEITNPGAHLAGNDPASIARGILNSAEFEGLILNPAMENQFQISRDDLEAMLIVAKISGESIWKKLFSLRKD
ncbi:hypothetical protein JNK13_05995 [bacterium]|nr:hypothetical protein [bacterium]